MKGGVVPPGIEPGTHGFSVTAILSFAGAKVVIINEK